MFVYRWPSKRVCSNSNTLLPLSILVFVAKAPDVSLLHFFQLQPSARTLLVDQLVRCHCWMVTRWKMGKPVEMENIRRRWSSISFQLLLANVKCQIIWWRLVKVKTCQNVQVWMFKVLLHKNLDLRKPATSLKSFDVVSRWFLFCGTS